MTTDKAWTALLKRVRGANPTKAIPALTSLLVAATADESRLQEVHKTLEGIALDDPVQEAVRITLLQTARAHLTRYAQIKRRWRGTELSAQEYACLLRIQGQGCVLQRSLELDGFDSMLLAGLRARGFLGQYVSADGWVYLITIAGEKQIQVHSVSLSGG